MELHDFEGMEVVLYPSDSYHKQAIVEGISPEGVIFRITMSRDPNYKVGGIYFIAYSARLSFAATE